MNIRLAAFAAFFCLMPVAVQADMITLAFNGLAFGTLNSQPFESRFTVTFTGDTSGFPVSSSLPGSQSVVVPVSADLAINGMDVAFTNQSLVVDTAPGAITDIKWMYGNSSSGNPMVLKFLCSPPALIDYSFDHSMTDPYFIAFANSAAQLPVSGGLMSFTSVQYSVSMTATVAPEPSGGCLAGLGVALVAVGLRRRAKKLA